MFSRESRECVWKGFRFEALDVLEETGYFNPSQWAKSVAITNEGSKRTQALVTAYLKNTA